MSNFVKMRGFFLFVFLLINCTVSKGQIYKYIGLEDGLNNQKIYHIQKDRRGYMWFLTQEGIERVAARLGLTRRTGDPVPVGRLGRSPRTGAAGS